MTSPDGFWGMGRGRASAIVCGVLLAAAALAYAFTDTVDLWISAVSKIDGTLRPADERESYVLAIPRDATVSATVKRKGKGDLVPFLDLLHPDLATIVEGDTRGKRTKLKNYVVPASGEYRLRISGDGVNDGNYRATLVARPRTSWGTDDGGSVAPGATAEFPFASTSRATLKITLTAAKGSQFVPEIVEVRGPELPTVPIDPPAAGAKTHKVSGVSTRQFGEHVVVVRNAGTVAGSFAIHVKLTLGKAKKSVVDLRDGEDDELSEEAAVYGRVVDDEGGLIAPTQSGTEISDTAVDVPAGAVSEPIVITISADENFYVGDDENTGGPAIEFGPEGVTFAEAVTITIPFNPQAFDDPENEIEIVVRNSETGELESVPGPYDIDLVAGTITVLVPHFSTYQSISRRPRPVKGTFVEMEVATGLGPALGGGVGVGLHPVSAKFGTRNGNAIDFTENSFSIEWRNGTVGPELSVTHTSGTPPETGTVSVLSNREAELVLPSGRRRYRRGRSDGIAVGRTATSLRVLLRVAKRSPTKLTLAGTWHAFVFEHGGRTTPNDTVALRSFGRTLDIAVDIAGNAAASRVQSIERKAEFPGGAWTVRTSRVKPPRGRLTPNGPSARLQMPVGADDDLSEVTLIPVLRGDLLVGRAFRTEGPTGSETAATVRLVVLVRADDDVAPADLLGHAFLTALVAAAKDRTIQSQSVPVLALETRTLDVDFLAGGRLTAGGASSFTRFDVTGLVESVDDEIPVESRAFRVWPDGRYSEPSVGFMAAVTRRREAFLGLFASQDRLGFAVGVPGAPLDE